MKKYLPFLAFFSFILLIIWEANQNATSFFYRNVMDFPLKDKVGHFCLFGILAFLLDLALKGKNSKLVKWKIPTSIILVLSFALLEEITQYWIPTRNFDLNDAIADFVGIVFFVKASRFLQPKITKAYSSFYTPTKKNREVLK